jgi:hypothetical protein
MIEYTPLSFTSRSPVNENFALILAKKRPYATSGSVSAQAGGDGFLGSELGLQVADCG